MTGPRLHRDFERELRELREQLILMAGRVESMIADSVRAFRTRDRPLAERTITADHEVNRAEIELDDQCLQILALRQPVASDLRFVTLVMKMVTDLERIADLAASIAERARAIEPGPQYAVEDRIPEISALVQEMLRDAINAFVERDEKVARGVIERDDEVDDLYHHAVRAVLEQMRNEAQTSNEPAFIDHALRIKDTCKYLERMGDHVTNLCEHVIFLVKGTDIRHAGKR